MDLELLAFAGNDDVREGACVVVAGGCIRKRKKCLNGLAYLFSDDRNVSNP